jgi:hypothetical protein
VADVNVTYGDMQPAAKPVEGGRAVLSGSAQRPERAAAIVLPARARRDRDCLPDPRRDSGSALVLCANGIDVRALHDRFRPALSELANRRAGIPVHARGADHRGQPIRGNGSRDQAGPLLHQLQRRSIFSSRSAPAEPDLGCPDTPSRDAQGSERRSYRASARVLGHRASRRGQRARTIPGNMGAS